MEATNIQFHKGIESLLKENGISQRDLSHRTGLSRSYISRIVRGERKLSMRNAYSICQAIDVTINELISRSVENIHPEDREISRLTKLMDEKFKELDLLMKQIDRRTKEIDDLTYTSPSKSSPS